MLTYQVGCNLSFFLGLVALLLGAIGAPSGLSIGLSALFAALVHHLLQLGLDGAFLPAAEDRIVRGLLEALVEFVPPVAEGFLTPTDFPDLMQ